MERANKCCESQQKGTYLLRENVDATLELIHLMFLPLARISGMDSVPFTTVDVGKIREGKRES